MTTFKVGLLMEHELRKSLPMKPALSMRQLIDRIDKYKQVEEDQTQGKGKAKVFLKKRDPRRVDIIITVLKETSPIRHHLRGLKWLIHCSKSQSIRYWRR